MDYAINYNNKNNISHKILRNLLINPSCLNRVLFLNNRYPCPNN